MRALVVLTEALAEHRAKNAARVRAWRQRNPSPEVTRIPYLQSNCGCDLEKVAVALGRVEYGETIRERFLKVMKSLCGKHLLVILREIIQVPS